MQKSVILEKLGSRYIRFIEKGIRLERFFLIFAIFFGLGFMIVHTPNAVYDERIHYVSAYHYSNVLMGKGFSMEDGSYEMRYEDAELLSYSEYNGAGTIRQVAEEFEFFSNSEEAVVLSYGLAGNFWQYLPQIIGITLGRLLHLGALPMYYLGRMFNLAFYIGLVLLALRRIPFGKTILTLIALLPISIQQAASYNYDGSLFGLGFLFLAMLLELIYTEQEITGRYTVAFGLVTWLFAAQKMGIYVILCILLFLLPRSKFKSTRHWLGYIFLIGGIYVLSVALNDLSFYLLFPKDGTTSMNGADPVVTYAVQDLLKDPLGFFRIIGNSIVEKWEYYIFSLFGNYFASYWLKIPDSYGVQLILLLCVAVFTGGTKDERKAAQQLTTAHRSCFLLVYIVQWLIYWGFFMLTMTPVGETVIYGVQGRYFVTVVPLLFFMGLPRKRQTKYNHDRAICVAYAAVLLIMFSLIVFTVLQEGDAVRQMMELSGRFEWKSK